MLWGLRKKHFEEKEMATEGKNVEKGEAEAEVLPLPCMLGPCTPPLWGCSSRVAL